MKLENNWQQKSLENLEKIDAGMPDDKYFNLVNKVLRLRKKPLNQFSIEDIRLMMVYRRYETNDEAKRRIALSYNLIY